jgi:putative endonuclease
MILFVNEYSEMAQHLKTGEQGEEIARNFLTMQGYEILATNFTYEKSEIDIIAKDDDTIVFVEVKTRSSKRFGLPEEAVTEKKQEKLMEGATYFLEENKISSPIRFDIIAIYLYKGQSEIFHIKDAF